MGMYDDVVNGVSENIEIGGHPFYAENITGGDPFNRREYTFKPVLNGTLSAKRGKYIQRKWSFSTTVYHANGRPDSFDKILEELCSKPQEVISSSMSKEPFKAVIIFKRSIQEGSRYHTDYDVEVIEVPDKKSRIPGEETILKVPDIKKIKITESKKKGTGSKTNSDNNKKLNDALKKCNVPFRKGQKNKCVKTLQEKLINLGFLDKKHKSGKYDAKTVAAVKAYQRSTKGVLKVDGVFGKLTRNEIIKT
jgi:murein L,D-transpeptidase YcbB/YkuD